MICGKCTPDPTRPHQETSQNETIMKHRYSYAVFTAVCVVIVLALGRLASRSEPRHSLSVCRRIECYEFLKEAKNILNECSSHKRKPKDKAEAIATLTERMGDSFSYISTSILYASTNDAQHNGYMLSLLVAPNYPLAYVDGVSSHFAPLFAFANNEARVIALTNILGEIQVINSTWFISDSELRNKYDGRVALLFYFGYDTNIETFVRRELHNRRLSTGSRQLLMDLLVELQIMQEWRYR